MAKFLFQKGNKYGNRFKKGYIPWNKKPEVEKKCLYCGKVFKVLYYRRDKKYCDRKCWREWFAKNHWGKRNPSWKGGITPLRIKICQSKQYLDWRLKIFEKDNYICWICKERGKKIQAHHLKRFSEYPKLRFKIFNGLTLCEFCHRTYTQFGNQYF